MAEVQHPLCPNRRPRQLIRTINTLAAPPSEFDLPIPIIYAFMWPVSDMPLQLVSGQNSPLAWPHCRKRMHWAAQYVRTRHLRQRDETLNKLLLLTTHKREANAQDPYTAVRDIDEYYERYTQLIMTLMELARVLQEEEHIIKRPIQWFVALDMPDQFVSAIVPSAAMEMKKFLWGEGGVRQGGCIVVGSMDADIVNHFYPGMLMIYEALKAPDLEDQIEETEPMEVEEQEEHEEEAQPISHYANTDELELDIMEAQTYQEQ